MGPFTGFHHFTTDAETASLTTHSTPTPAANPSFKTIRILVQPPGSPSASGPILFGLVAHAASFTSVRKTCPRDCSSVTID